MSNRSYEGDLTGLDDAAKAFQFPVGMSNRSYNIQLHKKQADFVFSFQFPVGMSNRSYMKVALIKRSDFIPFNSPWECRIGLTY